MRWLVLSTGILAACSALPGVSIGGDAGAPDAGDASLVVPTVDAADNDAKNDAADAEAATDGGARDASDASDAAADGPTWCQLRTPLDTFCDDFDRGAIGATWDFFLTNPPGTAALDTMRARSAPSSLAIVTREVPGGEFGNILLRKTVDGAPSRTHLAFDFLADAPQAEGTLAIATLDLATNHLFTLYLRDDDASPAPSLVEVPPTGPNVRNVLSSVPAAGGWTHIDLDLDVTAGTATLLYDTTKILDAVAIAKSPTSMPTIRIGALASGPTLPYSLHFDNVTLDVTP